MTMYLRNRTGSAKHGTASSWYAAVSNRGVRQHDGTYGTGNRPAALLQVSAPTSITNWENATWSSNQSVVHSWEHREHLRRLIPESSPDDLEFEEPDTLFTHIPGTILSAYAHPNMRHTMPTLLAMAHMEHRMLQPSEILSKHSSRLAKWGQERGLVVPNPENPYADTTAASNWSNIVYEPPELRKEHGLLDTSRGVVTGRSFHPIEDRVPSIEVAAARHHLRSIISEHRKRGQ